MHDHSTHEIASLVNSEVIIIEKYIALSPALDNHTCRHQYVAVAHGSPMRTLSTESSASSKSLTYHSTTSKGLFDRAHRRLHQSNPTKRFVGVTFFEKKIKEPGTGKPHAEPGNKGLNYFLLLVF